MVSCIRLGSHFIYKLRRSTTLHEMAAFQGLPRAIIDRMKTTSQSEAKVGAAIGDAISINVLMRLLPLVLESAGMFYVYWPLRDVWAHCNSVTGIMPDALYTKTGCFTDFQ